MKARKCGKGMAGGGRICLLAAGISLGLCGCGGIGTGAGADTETELKEGQRTAEIRVISITGNELTYMEIEKASEEETMTETSGDAIPEEESVTEVPGEEVPEEEPVTETSGDALPEEASVTKISGEAVSDEKVPEEQQSEELMPEKQKSEELMSEEQQPADLMQQEGMPEEETESFRQSESAGSSDGMGADSRGERPETGQREDVSMPEAERNGRGQMPAVTRQEVFGEADAARPGNGAGADTEGVNTIYLPVRITVHTDTGKETTFSILEAGDLLEALFETDENGEEVITEIWMMGE